MSQLFDHSTTSSEKKRLFFPQQQRLEWNRIVSKKNEPNSSAFSKPTRRPKTTLQSLSKLQALPQTKPMRNNQQQQKQVLVISQEPTRQELYQKVAETQGLHASFYPDSARLLAARMVIPDPQLAILEAGESFSETYAIYRQLRQTAAFAAIPVLFVVQPSQASETIDACNFQNNDYIVIPFNESMLQKKLETLLRTSTNEMESEKFPAGELLGRRYEVVRFLGEGGMGQVYQVRDLKGEKTYAFKLLFCESEESCPQSIKRFQKEIEALLVLDHPNIIKIYDFGQHQSFSFYTMDYLPHGCLADLIEEKGALSYKQALQLLIPIGHALHHAHQKNLLHRDLKPGNIMFNEQGAPILTDFGLALKIAANRQTRLTKKGHIIGTANYMSPEQVTAPQTLDARADIYALGAMFFEMITGRPPFVGDNYVDVLKQVLTQPPPDPHQFNASIPQHVSLFCQIAMTRDREKRFPTAAAMVAAAGKLLAIG